MKRLLVLLSAVSAFACKRPTDLDRKSASAIITKYMSDSPVQNVRLHGSAPEDGAAEGAWDVRGNVMGAAAEIFRNRSGAYVTLVKPLRREVATVTGIASAVSSVGIDASNLKEVQFAWYYPEAQGLVKRLIAEGGTGVAILRKFDDGWRVSELKMTEADHPFVLQASDIAQRDSARKIWAQHQADEQLILEAEAKHDGEEAAAEEDTRKARTKGSMIETMPILDADNGREGGAVMLFDVGYQTTKGEIFFTDVSRQEPTNCETPASSSWKGYCFEFPNGFGRVMFAQKSERDRFVGMMKRSFREWRVKNPRYYP